MTSHQPDQKKSHGNLISLAQWFSHKGRISRKTWWIFYCMVPVCLMVILGAAQQMIKLGVETPHKSSIGEYAMLAVFYALGLVILWVGFAGLTKRWHDQGRSGWWAALLFVPIIFYPLFPIFLASPERLRLVSLRRALANQNAAVRAPDDCGDHVERSTRTRIRHRRSTAWPQLRYSAFIRT
jgi:uncharacterized membrane protein YhaH (DUF805 family)